MRYINASEPMYYADAYNAVRAAQEARNKENHAMPLDIHDFPEGTTAVCVQCDEPILLDLREGGGPAKDWGSRPENWVGNGGTGMDYGCSESPLNNDEGTGGHSPKAGTVRPPA